MRNKRVKFIITGFVQGVGYRYFVYRKAVELGLKGYAKNLHDGTVETVVEGSQEKIDALFHQLKQGPSHSHVENCKVFYSELKGEFRGFDIF